MRLPFLNRLQYPTTNPSLACGGRLLQCFRRKKQMPCTMRLILLRFSSVCGAWRTVCVHPHDIHAVVQFNSSHGAEEFRSSRDNEAERNSCIERICEACGAGEICGDKEITVSGEHWLEIFLLEDWTTRLFL